MRNRLIHTASVQRESRTIEDTANVFNGYAQVIATLRCLVEPMGAARQAIIFGNITQGKFHISWGTETLLDGDLVTWQGRVYRFQPDRDDRYRSGGTRVFAFQTGMLEEQINYRGED